MQRTKGYDGVVFSPEVIKEARDAMRLQLGEERGFIGKYMRITLPDSEAWRYDEEEEFFADYRNRFERATFKESYTAGNLEIECEARTEHMDARTTVTVEMARRAEIMKIFNTLDANVDECRLPERPSEPPRKARVFIGHGRDNQWRDLKDHLHDKHDIEVAAYEIGARAGLTVQEVLDEMLTSSSFALLVLTGEDEDAQGRMHARENVVHELGLFQGRLGRRRAIILLEEDVQEFSNIQGVNQIRFSKSGIDAVYGEVLATIRREFG